MTDTEDPGYVPDKVMEQLLGHGKIPQPKPQQLYDPVTEDNIDALEALAVHPGWKLVSHRYDEMVLLESYKALAPGSTDWFKGFCTAFILATKLPELMVCEAQGIDQADAFQKVDTGVQRQHLPRLRLRK